MKRHAPATARNSVPLANVLAEELPERGIVLEIASGSGEHAVFMARRFPALDWQPTDLSPDALSSIDTWADETGLSNIRRSLVLDASEPPWPVPKADAILCVNMIHISPFDATMGLISGAAALLDSGHPLILYGPFLEAGVDPAPSNIAFDESLKARDPAWGLRTVEAVDELAEARGLIRTARYSMPANNLTLVYRAG